jgi:hypothetical protein
MTPFIGSGKLADLSRVLQFHLVREGADLTLAMRLFELQSTRPYQLWFRHVSGLKVQDLSGLVSLVAEDISWRGWDRLRFAVADRESRLVSFWCERIDRA